MSDPTDKLSAQGPIVASRAERQVQFISDALRAGERAILVSGRDLYSTRVPDAPLAACVSAAVRVLRIGRPLPELVELQEMIGAAAGVTRGRGMAPQALARLLHTAEPRQSVILVIDDADSLPRQTLYYLAQMLDVLATGAPALQIVFAAGPALLDTLSHPDFETFRNRITFAGEVTEPSLERVQQKREPILYPDTQHNKDLERCDDSNKNRSALARASATSIAPLSVQIPPLPTTPRPLGRVSGRISHRLPVAFEAALVLAMSCLVTIGYFTFFAFSDDPTQSSAPAVESGALQKFAAAPDRSPSAPLDPRQTHEVITSLIDQATAAAAAGRFEEAGRLEQAALQAAHAGVNAPSQQVETALAQAVPPSESATAAGQPETVGSLIDQATAAAAAGRFEEARRLEQAALQVAHAGVNAPSQQVETALAQALPPSESATAAGQSETGGKTDQPILFPKLAAPAAPDAVPNQPVDVTQRAQMAMVPDGAAALVAADLPAFAPIRVVLIFARNNVARAERTAAIREALMGAEVEVANLVAVDAQRPRPSIGYYFRSDRDAAVGVCRRLEPLLGAVEPVLLQLRGRVPPGTIEIAVP
jgi:hypothetical protein